MKTSMEKRCEFCMALRPVVFCKSDAAHLCLSCDAKVHSANALSYRHPRTLICESCRFQPALVRCFGHGMFMCQSCDISLHVSLEHHKKIVSCYVGCPSAKDLAQLWGFNFEDQSFNFSHSADSAAANSDVSSLVSELDGVVSSSRATKVVNDEKQQQSSYLILQQIQDLERLQLSEGVDDSCLAHVKERTGGSPLRHDATWKDHGMPKMNHLEHSDIPLDFQHKGSSVDKTGEPLSSPFPQLEAGNNPLNGDAFWQYRSPVHNNEVWLQNMQDLGVCDEVQYFDDVNIPDVDLTFRNFEELFGSEQDAPDDKNIDKHPSFGKIDRGYARTIEDIGKEMAHHHHQSQPTHPLSIRPSYSVSSFSVSRITGESSGSEYKDDELSPTFPTQHVSFSLDSSKSGGKENASLRYKEKKVARHEKQGQYTSPRSKSDFKKRGNSRVLKVEGMEGDSRSF